MKNGKIVKSTIFVAGNTGKEFGKKYLIWKTIFFLKSTNIVGRNAFLLCNINEENAISTVGKFSFYMWIGESK